MVDISLYRSRPGNASIELIEVIAVNYTVADTSLAIDLPLDLNAYGFLIFMSPSVGNIQSSGMEMTQSPLFSIGGSKFFLCIYYKLLKIMSIVIFYYLIKQII